jgi:hypothetical protein
MAMTRQKTILIVATAAVLLGSASGLRADTRLSGGVVLGSHGGIGVWIGKPAVVPPAHHQHAPIHREVVIPPPRHHYPPTHRQVVIAPPWRQRFIRIGAPRCEPPVVVVRPPLPEPVVIHPAPPVVEREIDVWVTNSNGSRTSVKLIQRGHRYIGPRGEYYDAMPTNEQLRVVYGF